MATDDEDRECMREAWKQTIFHRCKRRQVGAVVAKDGNAIGYGYNGEERGGFECQFSCARAGVPSGTHLDECRAIHAEERAILDAYRSLEQWESLEGATIYITYAPCKHCARLILEVGIKKCVYCEDYPNNGLDILKGRIVVEKISIGRVINEAYY